MKLKELKKIIDRAIEYAEDTDPNITILLETNTKEIEFEIDNINQFRVIPDVCIHIGKNKIASYKK